MNWLVSEQIRRNAARRESWSDYASHRAETTARLVAAARANSDRLCVLGAGNCDDLDLTALVGAYREVHLVDIDADALERGAGRLSAAERGVMHLHGGIDLTGCWQLLGNRQRGESLTDAEIDQVVNCFASTAPPFTGPFDVVASTCVVSQLIEGAVLVLGQSHPRLLEVVLSVRASHQRLMTQLLSPGGRGVLITDFVSSATLPALGQLAEPQWPELLNEVTTRGNFFHGLNPPNVLAALPGVSVNPRITGFWRWKQAVRTYAVVAIEFSM
ncbi:MAG TPA: hypothetical protein VJ783_17465 [Pirellulales bacterium]|nr:hypothetical protein [Pirellulales bacterium]